MNNTTSLTTLQRIAEQGNANAQFTLGQKYEQGDGVPKNDQQAIKWYRKAAEQDDCDAQFSLARLYEEGTKTIPQSYKQAITWYKRAAEQGDPEAQLSLGRMYETGHEEFPANITEAIHYYKDAAKQGSTEAMRQLAHIYEKMDDAQNAIYWYEQIRYERRITRNLDEATAQHHLGNLYEHGQVVAKDYAQAIHWYQKSAANKHFDSYFSLSKLYATSAGVTQNTQQAKEWLHKAVAVAEDGWDFHKIGDAFKALHDYPNAILCYEKAAEENDVDSHLSLSQLYATDEGITQDTQQAKEWLHKAVAVAEYSWDFRKIGDAFKALHDYPNAVRCYEKAAEEHDVDSHFSLSELYAIGEGVTQNAQQAKEWLHKAVAVAEDDWDFDRIGDALQALHDYPNAILCYQKAATQANEAAFDTLMHLASREENVIAQCALGELYQTGQGVKKDYAQAVHWFRKAAEQGYADAQNNLGVMHKRGRGVKKDDAQAIYWHRKAAEQGHAKAQFNLALRYNKGQGVKQDYTQAIYWYRKAAEQGHADAQNNLGVMYKNGQGVTEDNAQAIYWYQKAAEQGHAKAQYSLAWLYKDGRDYAQAFHWLRKAAEQGDAMAQFFLGLSYNKGQGVKQDYAQAYIWFFVAAANNYASALQLRDEVAQKLPPQTLAEAQQLAAQYFEKYPANE